MTDIRFSVLAAHVWVSETDCPWDGKGGSPFLGIHDGRALCHYIVLEADMAGAICGWRRIATLGWWATLEMTETLSILPASSGGTEMARFNALRHGVPSRYTVLPWEDAEEYRALVTARRRDRRVC